MTDLQTHLTTMISAAGLSGFEAPIRRIIAAAWQPFCETIQTSPMGSLHALQPGSGPDPRPGVLLAAHMDAIGMMVSAVEQGFLRIANIGGLDPRVLPGQPVWVHGRRDLPGVVAAPPEFLLPEEARGKTIPVDRLWVDTGLAPEVTAELVRVGDLVSFAQAPLVLGESWVSGHSLDNRASVAAVTLALEALSGREHTWDVWAAATVQEEVTMVGAATSAYGLRPALAIAIDVTYGDAPGAPAHKTYPLDGGVTLGWGPNVHPGLYREFARLAEALEIPYHREIMPASSGTDGMAMQVAAAGIPTMVVSIPIRNMHTPVELGVLEDIRRAGRLLAEFCTRLDLEFMERLSLD